MKEITMGDEEYVDTIQFLVFALARLLKKREFYEEGCTYTVTFTNMSEESNQWSVRRYSVEDGECIETVCGGVEPINQYQEFEQ